MNVKIPKETVYLQNNNTTKTVMVFYHLQIQRQNIRLSQN